jgi:hypothetical protein
MPHGHADSLIFVPPPVFGIDPFAHRIALARHPAELVQDPLEDFVEFGSGDHGSLAATEW